MNNNYGMPIYLPPENFCFKTYGDFCTYLDGAEFFTGDIINGKEFTVEELFYWWKVNDLKIILSYKYKK